MHLKIKLGMTWSLFVKVSWSQIVKYSFNEWLACNEREERLLLDVFSAFQKKTDIVTNVVNFI